MPIGIAIIEVAVEDVHNSYSLFSGGSKFLSKSRGDLLFRVIGVSATVNDSDGCFVIIPRR